MYRRFIKTLSLVLSCVMVICNIQVTHIHAEEQYQHSETETSGSVTMKVEWNDPVLGQPTTFHVSATGGSGAYKFRMDAPSYTNPNEMAYESVADPSRGEWMNYTNECNSTDYSFTMTASGTYNLRFYLMDKAAGVYYLRVSTYIQVFDSNHPSVRSIVQSAVAQCNNETDGSDYQKALWLHDWLLNQLKYDNTLKWSSAESALTRGLGTCQAYESAYSMLLSTAGIENAETRDTGDAHTWNAIKLDGEWYQVDCTWDDSSDHWYDFDQRRLYFGLTDELMAVAHPKFSEVYSKSDYRTPSTSLKNNYFVKSGEAKQWAESYRDRIQNSLNSKQTQFSIQADNSTYPPSIYKIQNGIIAYVMNQNEWFLNGKKVTLVVTVNDNKFDFTVTYPIECTKHDWDQGKVTTEPTCTKEGIKTYTCKNCATTKIETIKSLGHDYSNEWTVDKEATCTQEGSKSHHCTRCDDKKDVTTIPKTDHHFDNGVITKQATTTETGLKTYTCQDCKTTKSEIIPVIKNNDTVDSEAPVIDVGSIKFSKDSATVGDTVKISVKITDNVVINESAIILENYETGKKIHLQKGIYNENTKKYECSLDINDDIPNGHWYISSIQARDKADNLGIETFQQNEYSFIVQGTKADSEAPVIDVNSIKFSKDSATVGDNVNISAKITDNVGINESAIILENYETGKKIHLQKGIYNENTKKYECSLDINDDIPNGHWYISSIQARDKADNLGIETFQQNEYSFIVQGTKADSEAPVIDVNSIKFSKDSATVGDNVNISAKITDNVGINESAIILENYETGKKIHLQKGIYNENTKKYECSLDINDDIPNGHWYISSIQVRDEVDNLGIETFQQNEYSFIVMRNNVDVHKWNDGIILQQATCTKQGLKEYTCLTCNTIKTETIKALGHDYSNNWTIDKIATCTQEGSKSHHCTRCDAKKDVTTIPKTDYNWDSGVETTKATCTKDGVKTYTCKNCATTKTETIKALGHDYSNDWTIDKVATCQEEGSKSHHCTRCDDKKDVTVIPKLNHNWDLGVETAKATCIKDGVKTYTCKNCATTKTETIKALGHDYSNNWTIDKIATCTQEGSKSHHCTRCDAKKDVTTIPKTDYNWDSGVETTKATCTKDGVKTYTCKNCATTKTEIINALGHDYSSAWTIDKEATCKEEGSKSHHCTRCDDKKDITTIFKTDHHFDSGVVTKEATCTQSGVKTYTCKDCKTTKTETIKALGHNYSSDWIIDKTATCTQEGSKSHHCTRCNDKKDVTVIPKLNHNWDSGVETTKATCIKKGVKTYTCKDCKTIKTETIKALGHDYSNDWTIDKTATCTQEGSKSHHCTRCDDKKDVTVIPKTNHHFDSGVETTKATCIKNGVKTYTCKNCKTTKTETIKALGHNYSSDWTIDKAATCTQEGSKSHHCKRCGDKKDVTVVPKTDHNWSSWKTVVKPTTTSEGKEERICKTCNTKQQRSIAKLTETVVETQKMYRLYNPNSGEHFYTANAGEKNHLANIGWIYEGIGWIAPKTSDYPVYRLYNGNGGEHHYTMNKAEKNMLVRAGWKYEGIGWYSADPKDSNSIPLLREYNPNAFANNHNYTTSKPEHNWLISLGWKDEGKAWYTLNK